MSGTLKKISSKKQLKKLQLYEFKKPLRVFHLSTGTSSGQPSLWARGNEHLLVGKLFYEGILKDLGIKKNDRTLVLLFFNLNGGWVAGNYTLLALHELTQRSHYNLTLYPLGPLFEKVIPDIQKFYNYFKHIICIGQPNFILQFLQLASVAKKHPPIYTITSGEKTTLSWKKHAAKLANHNQLLYQHINLYGCAEAGALAHENKLSIALTTLAHEHNLFRDDLLHGLRYDRPFTIMQFDPKLVKLNTSSNNEVMLDTTQHVIPLKNYPIGDRGHIISNHAMKKLLAKHQLNSASLKKLFSVNSKPFLVFMGREILGLLYKCVGRIYSDFITDIIHQINEKQHLFSGQFIYYIQMHSETQETLVIELEAQTNSIKLSNAVINQIIKTMRKYNSYIDNTLRYGKMDIEFKLIKPGKFAIRARDLQLKKIDAICQDNNSKARFILLS